MIRHNEKGEQNEKTTSLGRKVRDEEEEDDALDRLLEAVGEACGEEKGRLVEAELRLVSTMVAAAAAAAVEVVAGETLFFSDPTRIR